MQRKLNNVSVFLGKTIGKTSSILKGKAQSELEEEHKDIISHHVDINNQLFTHLPKMDGYSIYYSIDMNDQKNDDETFKEYIKVALKFIETRAKAGDFDERDYYFKEEHELKDFIRVTQKHMILINNIVLSNFNQVEGKF